jgi:transcription elongation factor Elf1
MKDFTKAQKKKYLKNSGKCPNCGSTNISGDSIDVDGDCCWQNVTCGECEKTWQDVYRLADVIRVD